MNSIAIDGLTFHGSRHKSTRVCGHLPQVQWCLRVCASFVAALCVAAPGYVEATRLIYEPFDYPSGGQVAGQGGTSDEGFSGSWNAITANSTVAADSLGYPAGTFTAAPVGNSHDAFGAGGGQRALTRPLSASFGDSEGAVTRWISVLIEPVTVGGFNGLRLESDTDTDDIFLGWGGGAATPSGRGWTFSRFGGGGVGGVSAVDPISGQTTLLVGKLEFSGDGGTDTLRLFVDPGDSQPSDASAVAVHTGVNYGNITNLGLQWNFNSIQDEIQIGQAYTDVAGIPEPSTFLLAALGLLGLLGFTRRRK
jgi:hypothetical protein